jgi:acetyl-CoA C-acetyltransferase
MERPPAGVSNVVIVGAARTPIGSFGGVLSTVPAPELGACAIRGALARSGVSADAVQACIMGNVLSAGLGQAPARQAALAAGLSDSCVCTTVNKVCSSGMKAVIMAAQEIQLGVSDVIVAGGMENMSLCPFYFREARFGARMGDRTLIDGMTNDGLTEPGSKRVAMGIFAERCATVHEFSRVYAAPSSNIFVGPSLSAVRTCSHS